MLMRTYSVFPSHSTMMPFYYIFQLLYIVYNVLLQFLV